MVKNLPAMQWTQVRALARAVPTCRGATRPVHRNKTSHCNEKPAHRNEDPMQPKLKINKINFKKKNTTEYSNQEHNHHPIKILLGMWRKRNI